MKHEFRITFQPSGRSVHVLPGTTVIEAAARAGLVLRSPCGGMGTCGKCRVRIVKGHCPPSETCNRMIPSADLERGYRLACQMELTTDCTVEIPADALFETHARILTTHGASTDRQTTSPTTPLIRRHQLALPAPTLEDPIADVARLERECGALHTPLPVLTELPQRLREAAFRGTAILRDRTLLDFLPGDASAPLFGVAFDLGTTTLVGTLVNLSDGSSAAVAAEMNPQISHGDDVISRITLARETPGAVAELQHAVVTAFNRLLATLCTEAGIDRRQIYEITVAGNTTMQHLLCGISPASLGEVPFAPTWVKAQHLDASALGVKAHPAAGVMIFPNIGGFVGGDTVAGILANDLHHCRKPTLLVDIGTNGEIVLAHEGRLLATSTAAGPAFEGARIINGMRAADGAIEKIVVNGSDLEWNVIGGSKPAGICGTALIDAAAVLLDTGLLDTTGRLLGPDEVTAADGLRARLHPNNHDVNLLLVAAAESKTGSPIYLYQRDIRELQLATGAIRAGISIMLRRVGLQPTDLDAVLLAGGFGNYIRRENACRIGLLPELDHTRIHFVGNASSMGAKAALLSQEARTLAETIAETCEHLDLSLDPEFQLEFAMAMMFPDPT